jgi:hypothetical protein
MMLHNILQRLQPATWEALQQVYEFCYRTLRYARSSKADMILRYTDNSEQHMARPISQQDIDGAQRVSDLALR